MTESLRKRKQTPTAVKNGAVSPNKRTMNFLRRSTIDHKIMLPVLLAAILMLSGFVKVGILNPLGQKAEAYSALAAKQEQLALANETLAGYDDLLQQYGRYSYGLMNDTEINLVSRMDVLSLVETKIAPSAHIEDFAVNNNILTMNICGVTLKEASAIVKSLESSPLVIRAAVNSATADDGREARIFISITLTKQEATE